MLARGERLTELLKQPQYAPLSVEEQVCVIYAGTRGYLDGIADRDVGRFEDEFLSRLHAKHQDLLDAIRTKKALYERPGRRAEGRARSLHRDLRLIAETLRESSASMASLKEMRNRIGSVKATQKITKAMQMVAAAKLRRSQDAAAERAPLCRSAWPR